MRINVKKMIKLNAEHRKLKDIPTICNSQVVRYSDMIVD